MFNKIVVGDLALLYMKSLRAFSPMMLFYYTLLTSEFK